MRCSCTIHWFVRVQMYCVMRENPSWWPCYRTLVKRRTIPISRQLYPSLLSLSLDQWLTTDSEGETKLTTCSFDGYRELTTMSCPLLWQPRHFWSCFFSSMRWLCRMRGCKTRRIGGPLKILMNWFEVTSTKAKAAPRNSLARFSLFVFSIRIPNKKRKDRVQTQREWMGGHFEISVSCTPWSSNTTSYGVHLDFCEGVGTIHVLTVNWERKTLHRRTKPVVVVVVVVVVYL